MNYSHRAFLYGPVALLAIAAIAVASYWWTASNAMSRKLDAMNGHEVAPGIRLSFAHKTIGGFPFRVDGELDGLRIAIDTSHGPAVWTAEKFAFHSLTYGRTQLVFEAAGAQHVEWHKDNRTLHTYDFLPGSLRASVIMSDHRLARFDLDALNIASTDVSAAEVQLHLRDDPKIEGLDLFITADHVHFAPDVDPAFGPDMKQFTASAMVSPGSSFHELLAGRGGWRAATDDWHTRHGGVLVKMLAVNWGPLDAAGAGAMAVDDLHRPVGALHFTLDGFNNLSAVGAANGGLARALALSGSGSSPPPKAVLSFKDGVVYVGSAPADLLSPLY
jgi:hypothetical protein